MMVRITLARLALPIALLTFGASARADEAGAHLPETEPVPPSQVVNTASEATTSSQAEATSGFTLEVSLGYGGSTERVLQVELEPYGAQLRLELGYRFRQRARIGAYVEYGFGRSISQRYAPVLRDPFEFTAEASSVSAGGTIGYDVRLYFLLLRYSLGMGFTRLGWDFRDVPPGGILGFSTNKGSQFSFHIAPSLALLWPVGRFEVGLGFDYLVQTANQVPAGVVGKLMVGVTL